MKPLCYILLLGALTLFISACAPSPAGSDPSDIVVGVNNQFPDAPNYIKSRTFVFRHQVSSLHTRKFKDLITQSAMKYLASKGYTVIEVEDKTALEDGRVDMIIDILPLNIFKQDGTPGYGFYDRKILEILVKQPARSYVCMDMSLHRKGHLKVSHTGRQENFSKLKKKELPDTLDQLTDDEKKEMSLNLEKNITETVTRVIPMLGL